MPPHTVIGTRDLMGEPATACVLRLLTAMRRQTVTIRSNMCGRCKSRGWCESRKEY